MSVTTTSLRQGKFEARFWHRIFEEEVGRVKGHFGPLNTYVPCARMLPSVAYHQSQPLAFNPGFALIQDRCASGGDCVCFRRRGRIRSCASF